MTGRRLESKIEELEKELVGKRKEVFQLEMALSKLRGRLALQNLKRGLRVAFLDLADRVR
jgi:hypothetical protein